MNRGVSTCAGKEIYWTFRSSHFWWNHFPVKSQKWPRNCENSSAVKKAAKRSKVKEHRMKDNIMIYIYENRCFLPLLLKPYIIIIFKINNDLKFINRTPNISKIYFKNFIFTLHWEQIGVNSLNLYDFS